MLAIWSVPTLTWILLRRGSPAVLRANGITGSHWQWAGLGVVVGIIGFLLGYFAATTLPEGIAAGPGTTGAITGLLSALGVAASATGEEVFFRGFLHGLLAKHFGYRAALWGQAIVFLLPHLLLLLIDARLWIFLPIQFLFGLLLGLLRTHSTSIIPGVVAHVLTNILAGSLFWA